MMMSLWWVWSRVCHYPGNYCPVCGECYADSDFDSKVRDGIHNTHTHTLTHHTHHTHMYTHFTQTSHTHTHTLDTCTHTCTDTIHTTHVHTHAHTHVHTHAHTLDTCTHTIILSWWFSYCRWCNVDHVTIGYTPGVKT